MTREQIEQAIEDNLDSIAFTEDGAAVNTDDGTPATSGDIEAALRKDWRLRCMLRKATP
jgi:hypothetical protein